MSKIKSKTGWDIHGEHRSDVNGNPAGGITTGSGFSIKWQNGPLGRDQGRIKPNGAFVEDIILAAIDRIEYYQSSKFTCRENALAITKLQEALHWLEHRTADRERRGLEGTHEV